MAEGKRCPKCSYYMFAADEEDDPDGRWIYYECRNEKCKFCENVYEDRPITYHPLDQPSIEEPIKK